ncbi:6-phosphogluconolactonase [Jatrophihabitans sp. DSM 45814]
MAAKPELVVEQSADELASDVARRTLATLGQAQRAHGRAALVLTAGSIMESVWRQLASSSESATVDWSKVDVFWGDERYVPADSPDRNDLPAAKILFEHAPFSMARLFSMPASDGTFGPDLDAAAAFYAAELAEARRPDDQDDVPSFDVVLLGVGPDGHCASLFPEHPGVYDESSSVIAVRNSPKPPPNRISLSFKGLNAAREIWVVASGTGKADAVASALGGAGRSKVPSAGALGTDRTLWLVDLEAASKLPGQR